MSRSQTSALTVTERPKVKKIAGICDEDLVEKALNGDNRAEEALYRRHASYVAGLVSRLMGSTQDTDDILHDAFVKAYQDLKKLEKPEMFRAWVAQIAVNRVRFTLRRRRIERKLGLFQDESDATLEQLAFDSLSPERRADLRSIDTILKQVAVKRRIVWMLRMVEGHTYDEIAQLCGCTTSTAKRWFADVNTKISTSVRVGERKNG